MAGQTKAIRRRIKSVTNTRKITKAMELVAASKMRKAMQSVLGTRPYAKLAWNTVISIGSKIDTSMHPLLREHKELKRVLLLVISSDRGLAGGFNTNILRKTFEQIKLLGNEVEIQTVCVGKRSIDAMRRANKPVLASFVDMANSPKFGDVLPIGRLLIDEFTKGNYDKVLVAYTDFVSALTQRPVILELLPLGTPEQTAVLGNMDEVKAKEEMKIVSANDYTFEPSPQTVLDRILPRLVETMIFQAILESAASEHSARMMAMRSASDAAKDMLGDLTFTYNQARQAGITQEIAEISSGAAALAS
ncbi:MAG: ATP synthase F1 subunit gamma [Candidatus Uhrbacteria bacterium]|nr:ATP synthase F1 subunit gamma [Candidatus Uhrbacteria bacterium]